MYIITAPLRSPFRPQHLVPRPPPPHNSRRREAPPLLSLRASAKPPKGMACRSRHSRPRLPARAHWALGAERSCTGVAIRIPISVGAVTGRPKNLPCQGEGDRPQAGGGVRPIPEATVSLRANSNFIFQFAELKNTSILHYSFFILLYSFFTIPAPPSISGSVHAAASASSSGTANSPSTISRAASSCRKYT